ncbi:MAG: alpha amylase N-terminal ig-like domain-containing protein [Oscillospiraceae bacterium]|nr:alpha amylase N-terminal ig-like domain-containing protein [Oscillospiraceae bacterium]
MKQWIESVYSDGTSQFVSNPFPKLHETVTVRIRMYADAPVQTVFLRTMPNGGEELYEMCLAKEEKGFRYYEAELRMEEKRMQYHFYLVTEDGILFYNQKEVTTCMPGHAFDFVLLADYVQPAWVKDAVFYQIFPDRFCNGEKKNDVRSGAYVHDGHPTIQMEDWNAPALTYEEGFCLDFYGGDLQGIREKIPYLKELGVTAIYLNPIFTAPSVHKYDCIDYFHVDPHFGGDEALAELSAALHENGMKLILDISINHTGASHKWFNRDGLFFPKSEGAYNNPNSLERSYYFFEEDNRYHGWFGIENMPTLNYTADTLRDIIYRAEDSVLKKWLRPPYSIDGWRFDVADVFARNGEIQLADELWREIRESIKAENPEAYILAEDWGDCTEHMQGDQWDSPMNYFGCGRVIRSFLGEPDLFMWRNPVLKNAPVKMSAEDVKNRVLNHLARMPHALWETQFNLIDSHDVSRLANNPKVNREEYRGAVIFQFLLTGAASVYYGAEADIDGVMDTNEGCRYPMPWGKDFKGSVAYRLHQTMALAKKEHKALRDGGMKFLYAENGIVALARFTENEVFVGVISTNDEDVTIRLPLGAVGASVPKRELFDRMPAFEQLGDHAVSLTVKAHTSYFMECEVL